MLKDVTLGQYYPTGSMVHKLDPRIKILISFIFIISIFFVNSYISYAIEFIFVFLIAYFSKVPFKMILKGLKPLRYIIIITIIINLLFTTTGNVVFEYGIIKITDEAIDLSIKMPLRLTLLVMGTSLLTLTTSPVQLTDGIEGTLKPFKKIGLPSHEIAMMITIALRFIPTLIEETDKIMKAQLARGANFDSKNLITRAKSMVPLIVPLLINSLERADELAIAMEARCYNGDEGRTKLHPLKLNNIDIIVFIIMTILIISVVLGERFLWTI